MPDWFTWPSDLLLSIGGMITSCFVSRDVSSFGGIQTMVAILMLAAVVASIVGGQSAAEFFLAALQASRGRRHSPPSR